MTEQASNILTDQTRNEGGSSDGKAPIAFQDAALVEQVKGGDMRAFGTLVAKYQDRIYNLIFRMTGQAADAEELAQETFLKAMERIAQFRGNSQFYTWLFRIAANLTISHRRRGGRIKFHSMTAGEEYEESQSVSLTAELAGRRSPPPDSRAMASETSRRVMLALEELDEEFRIVAILRDMENMDYAGIAEVLAVPVGTVKSRLHRARSILKQKLADLVE